MLSDQELRRRLTSATAHLSPDLRGRARVGVPIARSGAGGCAGRRTPSGGRGRDRLVVAAGRPGLGAPRSSPPVVEHPDVPARVLINRGQFMNPRRPGGGPLPRACQSPPDAETQDVAIDVPAGWGRTTSTPSQRRPRTTRTTRRLDIFGGVRRVHADACDWHLVRPGESTLALAQALSSDRPESRPANRSRSGSMTTRATWSGCGRRCRRSHWTTARNSCTGSSPAPTDVWATTRAGRPHLGPRRRRPAPRDRRQHGPEVTPTEIDELVVMVESATFLDPLP